MRARTAALTLAAAEVVLFGAAAGLGIMSRLHAHGPLWNSKGIGTLLVLQIPMLAFPLFGGLLASRRPANPIGWICLGSGAFWFTTFFADAAQAQGLHLPAIVGVFASWVPAVGLLATFLLLLFPDGTLLSRRWRPVAWLSGATILIVTTLFALAPGGAGEAPGPYALHGAAGRIVAGLGILFVLLPVCMILSIASLVLRYRRSGPQDRRRLKWIALAGVAFVVTYGSTIIVSVLFDHPPTPAWVQFVQNLAVISYAFVPTAAWFAILRYRLFDIDRVISRTLSYAIVTMTLAGLYALVALVPTAVVGSGHVPSGLVAGAVLVVAALFRPVRRRVQSAVDHRFNRARYDAERTLEAFATRLRDEIDMDTLKVDLETLVHHTMEPAYVSLWLREITP